MFNSAQGTDPYAAGQNAYQREHAREMMNKEVDYMARQARTVYNAVGCKVVFKEDADVALEFEARRLVDRFMHTEETIEMNLDPLYDALLKQIETAKGEVAKASADMVTNCGYWHEHADAVYAMRKFTRSIP
jgi:hypothetical protein